MSAKTKTIALPRPKVSGKGKVIVLVLVILGGYFVVTDPAGSAAAVNDFRDSVATFASQFGGGR